MLIPRLLARGFSKSGLFSKLEFQNDVHYIADAFFLFLICGAESSADKGSPKELLMPSNITPNKQ